MDMSGPLGLKGTSQGDEVTIPAATDTGLIGLPLVVMASAPLVSTQTTQHGLLPCLHRGPPSPPAPTAAPHPSDAHARIRTAFNMDDGPSKGFVLGASVAHVEWFWLSVRRPVRAGRICAVSRPAFETVRVHGIPSSRRSPPGTASITTTADRLQATRCGSAVGQHAGS